VIEKDSGWLYSTPRSSEVAIPSFASGNKSFMGNKYESISLDGLVHWNSVIARSQAGAVATGRFVNMENVVFKTIDISKRKDGLDQFNREISIYRELENLQGFVIPTLIAYGNLGGLLQVIVLENVGKSITSEQAVQKHDEINTALQRIHEKGIVHGDLRLPNILVDEDNNVRIIDFGMSLKQEGGDIIESFSLDSDVNME
jgi:serine/threonine protein kinase